MNNNLTICNNCAGKIVISLHEHYECKGLKFCCEGCADTFYSPDNTDTEPIGLKYDLGEE